MSFLMLINTNIKWKEKSDGGGRHTTVGGNRGSIEATAFTPNPKYALSAPYAVCATILEQILEQSVYPRDTGNEVHLSRNL